MHTSAVEQLSFQHARRAHAPQPQRGASPHRAQSRRRFSAAHGHPGGFARVRCESCKDELPTLPKQIDGGTPEPKPNTSQVVPYQEGMTLNVKLPPGYERY